jgi:hypothetical protein
MKYAVHKGSGDMMHIPNFIRTGSGIQKFIGDTRTQTHRRHRDRKAYFRKVG